MRCRTDLFSKNLLYIIKSKELFWCFYFFKSWTVQDQTRIKRIKSIAAKTFLLKCPSLLGTISPIGKSILSSYLASHCILRRSGQSKNQQHLWAALKKPSKVWLSNIFTKIKEKFNLLPVLETAKYAALFLCSKWFCSISYYQLFYNISLHCIHNGKCIVIKLFLVNTAAKVLGR